MVGGDPEMGHSLGEEREGRSDDAGDAGEWTAAAATLAEVVAEELVGAVEEVGAE